jgi:tetratricopeptide (TPR) repeat protein
MAARAKTIDLIMTDDEVKQCQKLEALVASSDWRGVVAMEREARAVAAAVPHNAGFVYGTLGIAYHYLGDFSQAIQYHTLDLAIAKEKGDLSGDLSALNTGLRNLGIACHSQGDFDKAIEYFEQYLAITKELGDRELEGNAYDNLGTVYSSLGEHVKAIEYHTLCLMIAKEVSDRAGEGRACGNLGCDYGSVGEVEKAIEHHNRCVVIAKEVGDRSMQGSAYGNLGSAYMSQGDFVTAVKYLTQDLAIAKETGDLAGEGRSCNNLGMCHMHLGEHVKAIGFYERHLAAATQLGVAHLKAQAAMCLGVALRLQVTALRQGPAAATSSQAREMGNELDAQTVVTETNGFKFLFPAPSESFSFGAKHADSGVLENGSRVKIERLKQASDLNGTLATVTAALAGQERVNVLLFDGTERAIKRENLVLVQGPDSSASSCLDHKVCEAKKWLQAALDGGGGTTMDARLHLARLTFEAGQKDSALVYLKEHLSWSVQRGRDWCGGCDQLRGEDTQMLTCSGCRVARFCSADHQKMASKKGALGGDLIRGRHKDICGVLGKWRKVVKDGVSPDSCNSDLLAFLRGEPTTQRECQL